MKIVFTLVASVFFFSSFALSEVERKKTEVENKGEWILITSFDLQNRTEHEAPIRRQAKTIRFLRIDSIVAVVTGLDSSFPMLNTEDSSPHDWPGQIEISTSQGISSGHAESSKTHIIRGINFAEAEKISQQIIAILSEEHSEE